MLLLVGFMDGVKCSRSLLCGLPPPTHLWSSLGADRMGLGLIQIVEDGEDDPGPVQSVRVLTVGGVVASTDCGVGMLLGEGGVLGLCHCRSASIPCTHGVLSHLISW